MSTELSHQIIEQRAEDLEKELDYLRADHAHNKLTLNYLKSVLDNTNTPMFLKRADFTYIFMNKQFEHLTQIDVAQVRGKNDFDVFPKPVADLFRSQDEEVLKRKQMIEFEETITLQDGDHTFITVKFPILGNDGKIDAIGGVCTDITSRKKSEAALKEAEERYRSIFEHSPLGIVQIDADGVITTCNEKFTEIFKSSVDEIVGLNLFHTIKDERVKNATLLALSGKDVSYEGWYKSLNGKYEGHLQGIFSPIYASDKSVIATTCIIKDNTECKQAEEELKKAHEQLEESVAQRTAELNQKAQKLFETNTALGVLLEKRETDRIELEEKFVQNVEKMICPYLEKIRLAQNKDVRESLLTIVQANLDEIISPLTRTSYNYLEKLTPAQLQVAELVKHGHTTKEIANLLNLSPSTIACHRLEIRKRLSLTNKKRNLQSVLTLNA